MDSSLTRNHSVRPYWAVLAPYLAALAITLAFYSPRFLPGANLLTGDTQDQNLPNRYVATRALQDGRLPGWAPEVFGGFPFLCDPQPAVFYPFNLVLAAILPADSVAKPWGYDFTILGAVGLLAIGGTFLARRLGVGPFGAAAAGVIVANSGYIVSHLGHVVVLHAAAMALIATACLVEAVRRLHPGWLAAASFFFACGIVAGHVQLTMFFFYGAAVASAGIIATGLIRDGSWRMAGKRGAIAAGAVLLAVLLSGIQILPSARLVGECVRPRLSLDDAMVAPLPVRQAAALIFPGLYSPPTWLVENRPLAVPYPAFWGAPLPAENHAWIGLAAVALAAVGLGANRRRPLAWGLAFASVLVVAASLERPFSLYPFLWQFLPGFRQVRIPPRLLFCGFVCVAILAGMGIDALGRAKYARKPLAAGMLASWAAALALVLALAWSALRESSWTRGLRNLFVTDPAFATDRPAANLLLSDSVTLQVTVAIVVAAAMTGLALLALRARRPRLAAAGGVLLISLELGWHGVPRNIFFGAGPGATDAVSPLQKALPHNVPGRIATNFEGPWEKNSGLVTGVSVADGYNPLAIRWVQPLLPPREFSGGSIVRERMLDLFNVSHVAFFPRPVKADLGPDKMDFNDFGDIQLQARGWEFPGVAVWRFGGNAQARRVHVMFAGPTEKENPGQPALVRVRVFARTAAAIIDRELEVGFTTPSGAPGVTTSPLAVAWVRDFPPLPRQQVLRLTADLPGVAVDRVEVSAIATPSLPVRVPLVALVTEAGTETGTGPDAAGYRLLPQAPSFWRVAERPVHPGYAWMVPSARVVTGRDYPHAALAELHRPDFLLTSTVVLNKRQISREEAAGLDAANPREFRGSAQWSRPSPEHVIVQTSATQRGWLFVSETWFHGWRATVDGQPVPIFQANGSHRAVAVPTGNHRVEMRYRTPGLRAGAAMTAGGGVVLLVLGAVASRRRRIASG